MAKAIKCPNCGASQSEKISEDEYKCDFCDTNFHIENKKFGSDIFNAIKQVNRVQYQTPIPGLRILKLLPIIIFLFVAGISLIIFFSVREAVNTTINQANASMPKDEYWGNESVNKFYVFEGKKLPVVWQMINQSSQGLDSARYTIRLIDPKKDKLISNKIFMTMTWNEGFNFNNYFDEAISFNEKVYFLSKENGLSVYDLYTGKLLKNSDSFCKNYPELKAGIISSTWQGYRNSIELKTKDGFKYYFLPQAEKIITEKDFNDYKITKSKKSGFVLSEGDRPQLYYVAATIDTLRNEFFISDYYLKEAIKGNLRRSDIEKITPLLPEKIFFNSKIIINKNNQLIIVYSETLAKDSKSFIAHYSFKDELKLVWEKELKELSGFENLVSDKVYFQFSFNSKELAIWYWNAKREAIGIDLKSGKINWRISL